MPNIEGGFSSFYGESPHGYGAFYAGGTGVHKGGLGSNWSNPGLTFNASRSNSIYGKSNTVTPLSRKCLFLVKY